MSVRVGEAATAPDFPVAAKKLVSNAQVRQNVRRATDIIRNKRARVVDEVDDWEQLRQAGHEIKEHVLRHLDFYLQQFEAACTRAGGVVHWASDAAEANRIIVDLIRAHEATEVIKVKTMTSDEIRLNPALQAAGITPYETDLADLIVQLGEDQPSHIVVPALHRNRMEIRRIFSEKMNLPDLGYEPEDLTAAARTYLREKFLRVPIAISGGNFAIAETGSVCVVESEGNGRMCLSLPRVLITLIGIEKIIPKFRDLEVFLQLLPRSATGERMNPYNSIWTGISPGSGPREFHVVLLDNGRTNVLADDFSRETLDCIRCGACLNACPVYRQTGGHAYGSVYAGPIGAILTPQLQAMQHSQSLPYASSLCGACYEVCPVKINIPEILVHLRGRIVEENHAPIIEKLAMKAAGYALQTPERLSLAQKAARIAQMPFTHDGVIRRLPGMLAGWTSVRDLAPIPKQSFREWWAQRQKEPRL
jgi:L-lactate dehydrogenase complex protein LldF